MIAAYFDRWRVARQKRQTDALLASLPPIVTKSDGGAWILDAFQQQCGRPFDASRWDDRRMVEQGCSTAVMRAFNGTFGLEAGQAE